MWSWSWNSLGTSPGERNPGCQWGPVSLISAAVWICLPSPSHRERRHLEIAPVNCRCDDLWEVRSRWTAADGHCGRCWSNRDKGLLDIALWWWPGLQCWQEWEKYLWWQELEKYLWWQETLPVPTCHRHECEVPLLCHFLLRVLLFLARGCPGEMSLLENSCHFPSLFSGSPQSPAGCVWGVQP